MSSSSARVQVSMAVVVVAAVLVLAGGVAAQSSTSGCAQTLVSMSPCLGYITNNETAPSGDCCTRLGSVVKSEPQCLCVALNFDPASLGLTVNRTRALGLPDACNVKTPPLSECSKVGAPSPTSPSSGTPAGTGSKATPATNVDSGAGALLHGSVGLVGGLVIAVVYGVSAAA